MPKKIERLDLRELSEDTSSEEVAKALGIKIYPKGRQKFICCPGHELRLGKRDLNPTNAVLTPRGYHCFACGVSVSTADMIREVTGCSLKEAFNFMADLNGGAELYKSKEIKKAFSVSDEELEALNLNSVYESEISFSLLLREAPLLAKKLIGNRIEALLPTYEEMLKTYSSEEGAWKLYDYAGIKSERRNELLTEIKNRMSLLEKLRKKL